MSAASRGILDTSVLIAGEKNRQLGELPDEAAISVMTLAELRIGVLVADDVDERARRMETLSAVERTMRALPVDEGVASEYARLVVSAHERGVRPKIIDCLIAATASAHGVPVYTQDSDFEELAGIKVVRV